MTVASQAAVSSTSVPADTALQRFHAPLTQALDDEMQDDRLLNPEQEDLGLPVRRQTPSVSPTNTNTTRRHWLTKLKSCSEAEDVLATLDDLTKAVPLLNNTLVKSARHNLVELLQASTLSGKQYKKKRKLITKSSRKVLSVAVKQAFSKN